MATRLKNMKLTSVDLVRAGANQEADICLYKSADPQEATEQPTERETSILKRVLAWLRENPAEDENEPQEPTEGEAMLAYTDALAKSIQSIHGDAALNTEEKIEMLHKSLAEFNEAMEQLYTEDTGEEYVEDEGLYYLPGDLDDLGDQEDVDKSDRYDEIEEVDVAKGNPYHDNLGRFASAGAAGGGAFSAAGAAGRINAISDRMNNGGGKKDDWKEVRDVLQSAPKGTIMTQTGNRGAKLQYEKTGDDEWSDNDGYKCSSKIQSMTWAGEGYKPQVQFDTKQTAPTKRQVKDSQTAALNGQLDQWNRGGNKG